MNEDEGRQNGPDAREHRIYGGARENGLVQRLRGSYLELGERRPARVLLGFSGGADSLALLTLLAGLGRHEGFEVEAIHVDHGARDESAKDADKVRSVAGGIGIELKVRVIPPGLLLRHAGVGREEAMRRERYRIFGDTVAEVGADVVALAHHQRDQAETVLLHLLRGSGIRGASGMRSVTTITVPWWAGDPVRRDSRELHIWRPLLGESADDVRAYAESLGLPIVDDASNRDVSYRRNAVRHDVLPVLEEVMPGAVANLARFAGLAATDSDELDRQAQAALESSAGPAELDRRWLLDLPLAIRRRVVRIWIGNHAAAGLEVSLNRVDEVLRVASVKDRPRFVEIGLGVSVKITRDLITVHRR